MTQFADLGLAEVLLRALEREGYVSPTPIQARAIPPLLQGRDLLGIAQTGTGKTAAFALPILHRLVSARRRPAPHSVRALVLAPTRELAAQIAESFRAYGRFAGVSVGVVVGGVAHGPQIKALAGGLDVLVATPGRLLDHLASRHVRLDATEVIVLDEADHMLDLGFLPPIRQIVARLPNNRQNLFFSATMPKEIAGLAAAMLRDPVEVSVTPGAPVAERVDQRVFFVDGAAKRDLLVELLADPAFARALVFTRTKRGADRVAQHLERAGVGSAAIHGNKSQSQRQQALEGFRRGRTRVLVATDIAARGIDVDGVTHVVN
ncbi:MAG: DEAD/DEAH box helicase, partial [Methylocystis sp.]|nr:DEAD/DEAH box helicase [Methylocystis sp.]